MLKADLDCLKDKVGEHEERLDSQSSRMGQLEEMVLSDREKTILLLADHCERHDHQSNVAKLKCVLITGI
jgi:hypothetical protein